MVAREGVADWPPVADEDAEPGCEAVAAADEGAPGRGGTAVAAMTNEPERWDRVEPFHVFEKRQVEKEYARKLAKLKKDREKARKMREQAKP